MSAAKAPPLPTNDDSAPPALTPGASERAPGEIVLRPARPEDLAELVVIEETCFTGDRLSRRSLQRMLTKAHAILVVAERAERLVGYALLLLHGQTSLARLYSIAVMPEARAGGVGSRLMMAVESAAFDAGRSVVRLEVRVDNEGAIRRYQALGYREIGRIPDYYEDGETAIRMEKRLAGVPRPNLPKAPYYAQSLAFTCGPSCLMMAMKAQQPTQVMDRTTELRLWREATLVYMAGGHAGCEPFGLALAAHRRGFDVEILLSDPAPMFLDTVRNEAKKDVIRLVQEDYRAEAKAAGIAVTHAPVGLDALTRRLDAGAFPIVLISSWRLYGDREPHWVLLIGHDSRFLYFHDPFVDVDEHRTESDSMYVPVSHAEFERMARFGRTRVQAAVVVGAHA